jgi:hypothetical protein
LEQPYSLNDFQSIEEFSIKFKKQNPHGRSAFSLDQIIPPHRGLVRLKVTVREEDILIKRFLPKSLRGWNVQNYILTVDNLSLVVPLKNQNFKNPMDLIGQIIEPFEQVSD